MKQGQNICGDSWTRSTNSTDHTSRKGCDHEHTKNVFTIRKRSNVEMVDPRAAGDAFIGAFCTESLRMILLEKYDDSELYSNYLLQQKGAIESLPTSKQVREYMEQRDAPLHLTLI